MTGTFWSLVPPIVAIALALITKEVYSSLFVGILIGGAFFAIDAQTDHVLVGALNLQALQVQDHVYCCGIKSLSHRFQRNFGLHGRHNGLAAYIFKNQREVVHAGFAAGIANAERR